MKRSERTSIFSNETAFNKAGAVLARHMGLSFMHYSKSDMINKFYKEVCMPPGRAEI